MASAQMGRGHELTFQSKLPHARTPRELRVAICLYSRAVEKGSFLKLSCLVDVFSATRLIGEALRTYSPCARQLKHRRTADRHLRGYPTLFIN